MNKFCRSNLAFGFLILAMTIGFSTRAQQETKELTSHDFIVSDIFIGMSKVNVIKILGKGKSENSRKGVTGAFTDLKYAGLTVMLNGTGNHQSVFGILINSANYSTNRGLRVGDSAKKVLELYGEPASKYEQDFDYIDNEGGLLRINIKKSKVVSIYIGALDD